MFFVDDGACFIFVCDGIWGGDFVVVLDAFEDSGEEIVDFLFKGEIGQHWLRSKFEVEADGFKGIEGADGDSEEIVSDVVDEDEAFLCK